MARRQLPRFSPPAHEPQLSREQRRASGVYYTPPEIVQYMVTRVDTVLRQELGIADGLADPRVYVLDPCFGMAGQSGKSSQSANRHGAAGAEFAVA